jgi:hypothetical protein
MSTFFFTFLLHNQTDQSLAVRSEKADPDPWMADKVKEADSVDI